MARAGGWTGWTGRRGPWVRPGEGAWEARAGARQVPKVPSTLMVLPPAFLAAEARTRSWSFS